VINGGVVGAGAAKRLSAVRWGVAGNIALAWMLTLPDAAVVSAAAYGLTRALGDGVSGPLVLFAAGVLGPVAIFARRVRAQPVAVTQP
jgi:PiT family inorganic phosphate transporter